MKEIKTPEEFKDLISKIEKLLQKELETKEERVAFVIAVAMPPEGKLVQWGSSVDREKGLIIISAVLERILNYKGN